VGAVAAGRAWSGAAAAANCGFDGAGWSEHFSSRFAGQPFKSVAISFTDSQGRHFARKGEFVATATGIEGSLIYAASALLRDEIAAQGQRHAAARPAARSQRRAGAGRGDASARRALAEQPPEEPARAGRHQGRRAA
jgi:predicted flavoprotein YhiN